MLCNNEVQVKRKHGSLWSAGDESMLEKHIQVNTIEKSFEAIEYRKEGGVSSSRY